LFLFWHLANFCDTFGAKFFTLGFKKQLLLMIVVYFRRDGLTGFGIAAAAFLVAGALVAALIFRFNTCYQCCGSMTF
jgi:hypothetical protein